MNWELYEVWAEDEDGHEELIDTTNTVDNHSKWCYTISIVKHLGVKNGY